MAPFGREPGVVEVQPADHRADIERRLHRIELELRAGNARPVRHDGAGNDRAEQLGAGRIGQRLEAAPQRVDQAVARGFVRFAAFDLVARRVVGDVDQDLVGFRTDVGDRRGHRSLVMLRTCGRSAACASRRSRIGGVMVPSPRTARCRSRRRATARSRLLATASVSSTSGSLFELGQVSDGHVVAGRRAAQRLRIRCRLALAHDRPAELGLPRREVGDPFLLRDRLLQHYGRGRSSSRRTCRDRSDQASDRFPRLPRRSWPPSRRRPRHRSARPLQRAPEASDRGGWAFGAAGAGADCAAAGATCSQASATTDSANRCHAKPLHFRSASGTKTWSSGPM